MGFRVNTTGRVNQSQFSKAATVSAPRSSFDRSFAHKTTLNEGKLIPLVWLPILPGDTINLQTNILCRLSTPIHPYMDNVYGDMHYFFVPNRLVWEHWEQFQGAQDDPPNTFTEYEVPSLDDATHTAGFAEGSIYDYFGLPTKVTGIPQASMPIALPFRAYRKIWNDWYRDENSQDPLTVDIGDGPDTTAYALLNRNRRKDYFTSALPWPQKGPSVQLPLGATAPVVSTDSEFLLSAVDNSWVDKNLQAGFTHPNMITYGALTGPTFGLTKFGSLTGLETDLTDATAATVNDIRSAIVLQQILELDARGGSRYVEILLARFGVVSPDFRLQRPEYLGGQTVDINVSPVAQTSATDSETPQGNLSGFAVGRGTARITHSFVEHGQLLGLFSVRADTTYQQGMHRDWSVRTRYDYYEPLMANLGEQAVLNKEIYMPAAYSSTGEDALGYQERWAEQRYKNSYVTALYRSNATASLDAWHLAIEFPSQPTLADILPEAPPIERLVAVPSEPHFLVDSWTKFKHVRVMPIYSTPGLTRL